MHFHILNVFHILKSDDIYHGKELYLQKIPNNGNCFQQSQIYIEWGSKAMMIRNDFNVNYINW